MTTAETKINIAELAELKLKLEKEGMEKIKQNNNNNIESIINIIKSGEAEFVKKTGRFMTYGEIREMYG